MKPFFRSIAVLTLSAASLSAGAALKPTDLLGEPAVAPSLEPAVFTAVAERTGQCWETFSAAGDVEQARIACQRSWCPMECGVPQ